MYAALDKNGVLIYAQNAQKNKSYYCCRCSSLVKLVATDSRNYFRHINKTDNSINERQIHVQGKSMLLDLLEKFKLKSLESEVYLSKIQQRPDILINHQTAIEYQCAKINLETFQQRVEGYRRIGMESFWILGGSYLTKKIQREHLKFLNFNCDWGFYLLMLDSIQKRLILFHHIKFLGPFNRIFAEKIIFSKDNFLNLFTFSPKHNPVGSQQINGQMLKKLRQKNDHKSQQFKLEFYLRNQLTVEEYLENRVFYPQKPIYIHPAWQMACGQSKTLLVQPLLNYKKPKEPPQLWKLFLLMLLFADYQRYLLNLSKLITVLELTYFSVRGSSRSNIALMLLLMSSWEDESPKSVIITPGLDSFSQSKTTAVGAL